MRRWEKTTVVTVQTENECDLVGDWRGGFAVGLGACGVAGWIGGILRVLGLKTVTALGLINDVLGFDKRGSVLWNKS